ncbi:MAG: hypothetical protein IAF38_04555 [Bacteroidia bacterium]|nr:hypothetical protein [Bacteroidia bacterium]
MKKTVSLFILLLLLFSCGDQSEKQSEKNSVSDSLVDTMKSKRVSVHAFYTDGSEGNAEYRKFLDSVRKADSVKNEGNTVENPRTESSENTFSVSDRVLLDLAKKVALDLKKKDFTDLSLLTHPEKGVKFYPYRFPVGGECLKLSAEQIKGLATDKTKYVWGHYDGSGNVIKLDFEAYSARFILDRDYTKHKWTKSGVNAVEFNFPGTEKNAKMDWRKLILEFSKKDGKTYLISVIHDQWTI